MKCLAPLIILLLFSSFSSLLFKLKLKFNSLHLPSSPPNLPQANQQQLSHFSSLLDNLLHSQYIQNTQLNELSSSNDQMLNQLQQLRLKLTMRLNQQLQQSSPLNITQLQLRNNDHLLQNNIRKYQEYNNNSSHSLFQQIQDLTEDLSSKQKELKQYQQNPSIRALLQQRKYDEIREEKLERFRHIVSESQMGTINNILGMNNIQSYAFNNQYQFDINPIEQVRNAYRLL